MARVPAVVQHAVVGIAGHVHDPIGGGTGGMRADTSQSVW